MEKELTEYLARQAKEKQQRRAHKVAMAAAKEYRKADYWAYRSSGRLPLVHPELDLSNVLEDFWRNAEALRTALVLSIMTLVEASPAITLALLEEDEFLKQLDGKRFTYILRSLRRLDKLSEEQELERWKHFEQLQEQEPEEEID
ncbi:hypothetical protein [Microbacterium sp. KR10-403]|uniref:hypothetical protein n=1 Tax=Microbacterium sp. KR10-403 TaxID=3158581 RepID=UPI0032E500EE